MRRPGDSPSTASPLIVMSLAASGFAGGLALGYWTSDDAFRASFAGKMWVFLIGVNVGAWLVLIWPIIQRFLAVEAIAQGRRAESVTTFGVFWLLFVLPLWPRVLGEIARLGAAAADYVLPIIGGGVASAAMCGIWRIHAASRQLRTTGEGGPNYAPRRVEDYLTLHDHLQAFLWIIGALISLGTLVFGFAYEALKDELREELKKKALKDMSGATVVPSDAQLGLPDEAVWAYGLYYTTLLALSYVPAYIGLVTAGRSIRDAVIGSAPQDPTKLDAWLRRRDELSGYLQTSQGPVARLKAAVFVVSPLLASLLSTAIEKPT